MTQLKMKPKTQKGEVWYPWSHIRSQSGFKFRQKYDGGSSVDMCGYNWGRSPQWRRSHKELEEGGGKKLEKGVLIWESGKYFPLDQLW